MFILTHTCHYTLLEKSMEVLFEGGKGEIFTASMKWLDSQEEHLQLSGALAVGNFARSGQYNGQIYFPFNTKKQITVVSVSDS